MDWQEMEELISNSESGFIENNCLFDQDDLSDRIKKTLYYSPHKNPMKDTLSFSITKEAVESFRKAAPSSFGKLGHRYASRVARDACISPCSLLLGMIYIERLANRNPDYLQNITSSDLFLISMMIASKYLQDEGIDDEVFNDEWAASGLVDVDYINRIEADFLKAIDWRVLVKRVEFQRMLYWTETRIAEKNSFDRGWLTYTDITCLTHNNKLNEMLQEQVNFMAKAACMCLLVYGGVIAASVGTVCALRAATLFTTPNRDLTIQFGPPLHQPFHPTSPAGNNTGDAPMQANTTNVDVSPPLLLSEANTALTVESTGKDHIIFHKPYTTSVANQEMSQLTDKNLPVHKLTQKLQFESEELPRNDPQASQAPQATIPQPSQVLRMVETVFFLANVTKFQANSNEVLEKCSTCLNCGQQTEQKNRASSPSKDVNNFEEVDFAFNKHHTIQRHSRRNKLLGPNSAYDQKVASPLHRPNPRDHRHNPRDHRHNLREHRRIPPTFADILNLNKLIT